MKNYKTHPIGEFRIESGKVLITDPCYYHEEHSGQDGVSAKKGSWKAYVLEVNDEDWGNRITLLYAHHENFRNAKLGQAGWLQLEYGTGVDSGQAGFFDLQYFNDAEQITAPLDNPLTGKNLWYDYCCHQTLDTEIGAGVIPFGVVSSSGLGDGFYPAFGQKDGDELIALALDFQVVPNTFTIPALTNEEAELFERITTHQELSEDYLLGLREIDLHFFVHYCLYKHYTSELSSLLRVLGPAELNMDYIIYEDLFELFDQIKYDISPLKNGAEILSHLKYKEEHLALKWSQKLVEIGFMHTISNKNILDQLVQHLYEDKSEFVKFWIDQGLSASASKLNKSIIEETVNNAPKLTTVLLTTIDQWTLQAKALQGQLVQVTSGPFANFQGTVIGYQEEKEVYIVEISVFGRNTEVELSVDQLEMIHESS